MTSKKRPVNEHPPVLPEWDPSRACYRFTWPPRAVNVPVIPGISVEYGVRSVRKR